MASDAQFHNLATSRLADAAFDRLMSDARAGLFPTLYVYYRTRELAVYGDEGPPLGEGWTLAFPERVPGNLTREALGYWLAARTGRIPYLGGE